MRFVWVLAVMMLAACVPGQGPSGPKTNPLATDSIETTSLDAPTDVAPKSETAPSVSPDPQTSPAPPDEAPKAEPEATEEVAAPPPAPPPPPSSPEEARCLKSGGTWATAGESGAKACVKLTRDAGKACTRQSQCEGYCLARSRTCAPITPMFGCNDILQDDGREVTLCLD